jgi:hypothetical protein
MALVSTAAPADKMLRVHGGVGFGWIQIELIIVYSGGGGIQSPDPRRYTW